LHIDLHRIARLSFLRGLQIGVVEKLIKNPLSLVSQYAARIARKRVVVAGGAGFVGGHLCDRLIDEGHSVVCLDNLLTGRMQNIHHLLEHPRFTYFSHDVVRPVLNLATLKNGQVDEIYNLACAASPKKY
jgi:FlaA1/EpsC-like NDP-sugar epimerase